MSDDPLDHPEKIAAALFVTAPEYVRAVANSTWMGDPNTKNWDLTGSAVRRLLKDKRIKDSDPRLRHVRMAVHRLTKE